MTSQVWVLEVNEDTWRRDGWRIAAVFESKEEAEVQGIHFKSGPYAGYRVREVLLNPTYEQWNTEEEEEEE